MSRVPLKTSRRFRKEVNQMRAFADVPTPQRRYTYPPTFGGSQRAAVHVGQCARPVGEQKIRTKRLRRKQVVTVKCGGRVLVRRSKSGRHRAYCESCRARKQQRRLIAQLQQRARRFAPPQVQAAEDRRATRLLKRLKVR